MFHWQQRDTELSLTIYQVECKKGSELHIEHIFTIVIKWLACWAKTRELQTQILLSHEAH